MNNFNGWINVFKPQNISSFGVIKKIKKKFNILKIGHAGTLDPNAEGILPVAIGKTTKLTSLVSEKIKSYEFDVKWGERTSTDDSEGEIIETSSNIPSKEIIENNLSKFIGSIMQKPPKVSAVKINGKRAYKRFLNNEVFETKKKLVKVYNLKLVNHIFNNVTKFQVDCGKGFYVRSLARDLGEVLNSKAHIYYLKRLKVGNFNEKNSILLDDLLKISEMADGIKGFHSSISVLDDIPAIEINNDKMIKSISQGNKIKVDIFLNKFLVQNGKINCFVTNKGKIISLGKIDGIFFKPKKILL